MAHAHSVYDTDVSFKIDTKTKAIKKGSSMRTKLVQGDHNSEKFTFTLNSRHVEGHDMTLCNRVELHYINTDIETRCRTSKNFAQLDDLTVDLDTDAVTCSWMVTRGATKYAGLLQFLLTFKCIDDSGEEVYSWSTTWFTGMEVLPGGDNSDYVLEEFNDAFEQLRQEVLDAAEKTSEEIKAAVREELTENPPMAGATAEEAAQIAQNKTDIATLNREKLAASELPNAVNEALAQAKASGAFDGEPGKDGKDYVLTEADRQEIAQEAADMVEPSAPDLTGYATEEFVNETAETLRGEIPVKQINHLKDLPEYISTCPFILVSDTTLNPTDTTWTGTLIVTRGYFNYGVYDFSAIDGAGACYRGAVSLRDNSINLNLVDSLESKATKEYVDEAVGNVDIPTTLPNPNALTFTGAATGTYDGSAPLTVNIPEGGGGTGGGSAEWEVINTVTIDNAETNELAISTDANGNPFNLKKVYVRAVNYAASTTYTVLRLNDLPWTEQFASDALGTVTTSDQNPLNVILDVSNKPYICDWVLGTKVMGKNIRMIGDRCGNGGKQSEIKTINKVVLRLGHSGAFPEGAIFKVYGVRA